MWQAPEAVDSWKPNVLDAFRYGNSCIQPGELSAEPYPQHEDCLYLNVFVPSKPTLSKCGGFIELNHQHEKMNVFRTKIHVADIDSSEKLAVMFFIHGGGYTDGSGNDWLYGPDFLMENHVILVTINYRLGALGFLSLDLPEYSGNMGLKDQQLALEWVYTNIDEFGGDRSRITVFGQSAGKFAINSTLSTFDSFFFCLSSR